MKCVFNIIVCVPAQEQVGCICSTVVVTDKLFTAVILGITDTETINSIGHNIQQIHSW